MFIKATSDDLRSFLEAGKIILSGSSYYPSLYFPFFNYLGALALYLKPAFNPFLFLKLVFSLFDIGIVWLVYLISKKNLQTTLTYALNPISLIIANIHGQFDTIPLFFLMLGIYLFGSKSFWGGGSRLSRETTKPVPTKSWTGLTLSSAGWRIRSFARMTFLSNRKETLSLLSFSAAILTKTWPFLFITPIFKRLKNKIKFIYIITFPLLFILFHSFVFKTKIIDILLPIKNYRGVYGFWGIGNILLLLIPKLDPSIIQILRRIFLISLLVFSLIIRRKKLTQEVLIIMLFFFSFTLNYGAQWLLWLVPLIVIEKPKFWKLFMILATVYLSVNFAWDVYPKLYQYGRLLEFADMILGFGVWSTVMIMFILNMVKSNKIQLHEKYF